MRIESLSSKEIKNRAVGWSMAALVSLGVLAGGIYGWSKQGKDPLSISCRSLTMQTSILEGALFNEGTLGSDGGLIVRYLEVRNPTDSRLKAWGELKNQRDRVCNEARLQDQESNGGLVRAGTLVGGALVLFSFRNMMYFGRRLRNAHPR